MISNFRTFSKSPIAVVLFALIILSFAVFGISDVFSGAGGRDSVVRAGDRNISGVQFKQLFDNYRTQLSQQNNGQPVTLDEAVANGLDRRMVESLAYQESLAALVTRMGLRPSDQLVVEEIGKSTAFFDPISGRFDRATYQQQLAQSGLTEAQFESLLRDDIAQAQLVSGLAAGLTAPRTYAAALGIYNREGRDVRWFAVEPRMVAFPDPPTDEQLEAFISANAPRFTKPEMRQLTIVQFSAGQIAAAMPADEEDVQRRFEFERDSLSTPERRTVIQIPARDAAAAQDAAARLQRGDAAADVAGALGVEPVIYTDAPRTAIADRAVAEVAFAMAEGEVRAPVEGALGLAAVKVESVTPGRIAQLEDVRSRIEDQVRRDEAIEHVYDQVQRYEDARNTGSSLAEASEAVDAEPMSLPAAVTADGATLTGDDFGLPPQVLQAAFGLAEGGESEVENLAEGEYFAVRVDEVLPSTLATLDEVRGPAAQMFVFEELRTRMQTRADELAARIREGESVEQVARTIGAAVTHVPDLQRDPSGQQITAATVVEIFSATPGETIVTPDEQAGIVVARIDGVVNGDPAELARNVQAQRMALRSNLFGDIGFAIRNAARDAIQPRVDYARARTALGLEAQPATPPATAPVGPLQ